MRDPDGYSVTLDTEPGRSIQINGAEDFTGVGARSHELRLDGIAPNCTVQGDNPKTVSVVAGVMVETTFMIDCQFLLLNQIVFAGLSSVGSSTDFDIYTMEPDGSNLRRLTSLIEEEHVPQVSPDGRRIVYQARTSGISRLYTLDENGPRRLPITPDPIADAHPSWSPDGSEIAFSRAFDGGIYIASLDGTVLRRVTGPGAEPDWSPAGGQIAFFRIEPGANSDIWTVNVDGSSLTNLTQTADEETGPAWSPDGTRIAFVRNNDIWVMNSDGSNPTFLLGSPGADVSPVWSPDGSQIALRRGSHIWIINSDGSGPIQINTTLLAELDPAWTP